MIDPRDYKRERYRLTDEAEVLLSQWGDFGGCSCHTGFAPCSSCTHEGNPISLYEGDEYWEPEEEETDVSRTEIKKRTTGKSPWFGFKYRVNPETSKLLQEEVFKVGGAWKSGINKVMHLEDKYLHVSENGNITRFLDSGGFLERETPEKKIDIDPVSGKLVEVDDKGHIIRSGGKGSGKYFDMSELVVPMTIEEYEEKHKGFKWPVSDGLSKDFLTKEEKETMSSNRREVKISLFDDDKGLEVEDSKVGSWKILTEDDSDTAIRELLMTANVKGALDKHNEKRVEIIDKEVLHRTGQEVKLQPVKLKNLRWSVSEL